MEEITFDDLLGDHKPAKKTSIKIIQPQVAGRPFRPTEYRETKANWDTPKPEVLILFWSETACLHCGEVHSHPTYQQNSTMVRFRVSRFRTLLRPYLLGEEHRYTDIPRVRETTQSTVRYCNHCFDAHIPSLADFDFVGPPEPHYPIDIPCSDIHKPFAEVDYTESELNDK